MSVSVLQLVKRLDLSTSDIDSVDLMSLPTELQYEGWRQATPTQQGQGSVDDVITLLMNAGNDNTLATSLQSLDSKVKQTQWAQDPLNPVGIWLRSRLSTETNTRQSFIKELRRSELNVTDPMAYNSILREYQLGVTRMPTWENTTSSSIGGSAVSAHGGTVSYTVAGDAHARVAKAVIANAASVYLNTWIGAKSDRYGVNPANFVPCWTVLTAAGLDSTKTADATAVSGYKIVSDFGLSGVAMGPKAYAQVGAQTANSSDQRGRYFALVRAKITNSTLNTNIRIGQGYLTGTTPTIAYMPRLNITGTAAAAGWRYYPLGTVRVPSIDGIFEEALNLSGLVVAAEKISGSGNLEIDCITLIPAEHAVDVSLNYGYGNVAGGASTLNIITRPDQKSYAVSYRATTEILEAALITPTTWSFPTGSGVIVCAAQGATSGVSDQLTPTFTVYPSYSSLRGSS